MDILQKINKFDILIKIKNTITEVVSKYDSFHFEYYKLQIFICK